MIKLAGFAVFAGIVAASSDEPGVNITCIGDEEVVIDIGYDRSADLLKLSGGSCNASSVDYLQNNVTNAVQITLNMRDCELRNAAKISDDSIAFESSVEISLGRSDDGVDMVFYYNKVNLTCNVQVDYEVSVSYGEIDADYSSDKGLAGGEKAYTFEMRSTDSKYNETVVPSNRAGDTVYLDIFSSDLDFFLYKFSILWCTFSEMNGDSSVTEYNLFNHTENSCKNNFLDFSIKYCNSTSAFKISHTVFTFDPSRQNNYTLTCGIKLCDFDVAASNAKCEAFEDNCGIDTIMPKVPMVRPTRPNVASNSSAQNSTSNATVSANDSTNVTANATVSVNSTNTVETCQDLASTWQFVFGANSSEFTSIGCEKFFGDVKQNAKYSTIASLQGKHDSNMRNACASTLTNLDAFFSKNLKDDSNNGMSVKKIYDLVASTGHLDNPTLNLNEICQKTCASIGSNPTGCTV